MSKVVLDVNVLVSSLINPRGQAGRIQGMWRRDEARVQSLLKLLRDQAIQTPHALTLRVIEDDPEDDNILIAAVEGKANFIVSGDKHLKKLETYQGIPILTPTEFVTQHQIS